LGGDWPECAGFLVETGAAAGTILDPRQTGRRLSVAEDGGEGYVGWDDENPAAAPAPLSFSDVMGMQPRWDAVGPALAEAVGFDYGAWETDGSLRRIGSLQDGFGHVRAVLLFMPAGHFGDHASLVRGLIGRTDSTVLLPSGRWISPEIEILREKNGLAFVDLVRVLATAEADPHSRPDLPAHASRTSRKPAAVRPVIRAGGGLAWNRIVVEVAAGRTLVVRAPGQEGRYPFPPNARMNEDHALGILMKLAVTGEWRNPPSGRPDYPRVSKSFQRLQDLLRTLVPLPGKPFRRTRGVFTPIFEIRLHPELAERVGSKGPHDRRMPV
jgi:hypothetical protein